jgi:uncharacterized protein YgbK (DUF1537 family)
LSQPQPVAKAELLGRLPPIWPDSGLRTRIADRLRATRGCIVALDDDPTGTQTVHDAWVVCRPEPDGLRAVLDSDDPAVFILTNSRSLPEAEAWELNRRLAREVLRVAAAVHRPVQLVSRSDSTLRGHFPAEIDALSEVFREETGRPYDGVILAPYFAEGGRYTVEDIHWVEQGEWLIPAGHTAFARDHAFGYRSSRLPEYVEEKSRGRIPAASVASISIDCLRKGGPEAVAQALSIIEDGRIVVANAAHERDIEVLVAGVLVAQAKGKRFLYRSASSLVKVAAGMADRCLLDRADLLPNPSTAGALIVFGSIVPQSNSQLEAVLRLRDMATVELDVAGAIGPSTASACIEAAKRATDEALMAGRDVVLYTSRAKAEAATPDEALQIGQLVSSGLCAVVAGLRQRPRYLLGKGGITASDLATRAFRVDRARVLGQILPGVSVWRIGPEALWPDLPFIVFPGNVGSDEAVAELVQRLRT